MALDFDKLETSLSGESIIDPRKIFTTLARKPRFRRPSDEQGEVFDVWFEKRSRKDNTLKMNTGSGKTLAGLVILQSCLNEGVFPAVYVSAENYLVQQVIKEAQDLGIAVTEDTENSDFRSGKAILVINIWKLVNGFSAFGVGAGGIRIPIGALVIDDAHGCLATVAGQFSLKLGADHTIYKQLLALFRDELARQSRPGLLDIESGDPYAVMTVPFWAWKDHQREIIEILHKHRNEDVLRFHWSLLRDVLEFCQCVIGGRELEVAPRCLPIDVIPSFVRARRRIYMTATLADDGILVTHFQADAAAVADPIKPRGAGDMGDRLILAPQEINPEITIDEVRTLAVEIARARNVVIIVPSSKRANYWRDVAAQVLDSDNIGPGVEAMKAGHIGLTVLINRYDGVDLPGDACRMLIIDGLPEVYGLIERAEMAALEGTEMQLLRQVQRIEQGMGRGVRSSEDYCAVMLLGGRLTQRIHLPASREKFTPATMAQLDLGRAVTKQLRGKPLSELRPVLDYCLHQDSKWLHASRTALVRAPEGAKSFIDPAVKHIRKAFDMARNGRYDVACAEMQEAVNSHTDDAAKGYLKLQLAEYEHHRDPVRAQETLLSAVGLNRQIVKPLGGITYNKIHSPTRGQAVGAVEFMRRFLEPNDLIIFVNGLLEDLSWGEEGTKRFELAIRDLGFLLGFGSQKPEDEVEKGPDNLWALGGLRYLVIECKSGRSTSVIGKSDCDQLTGSMTWFQTNYDPSCSATPVMIHPVNRFDRHSSPLPETRVVQASKLEELKRCIRAYATAIAGAKGMTDPRSVTTNLTQFGLTASTFVARFSTGFSVERSGG